MAGRLAQYLEVLRITVGFVRISFVCEMRIPIPDFTSPQASHGLLQLAENLRLYAICW